MTSVAQSDSEDAVDTSSCQASRDTVVPSSDPRVRPLYTQLRMDVDTGLRGGHRRCQGGMGLLPSVSNCGLCNRSGRNNIAHCNGIQRQE